MKSNVIHNTQIVAAGSAWLSDNLHGEAETFDTFNYARAHRKDIQSLDDHIHDDADTLHTTPEYQSKYQVYP